MGACDFELIAAGKTLMDAYNNAVEEAVYNHGHDPYNGTISTCNAPKELFDAPRYGTKAYEKYVNAKMETCEKWTCYAIELKGKAKLEYKRRHGMLKRRVKIYVMFGMAGC